MGWVGWGVCITYMLRAGPDVSKGFSRILPLLVFLQMGLLAIELGAGVLVVI